jgi:processive 1,2-diacylglycerol beta-glucosyltransferase
MDKERKTILILAGSYGVLGHIDEMIDVLKKMNGCQVAIVCGRNQKLEQKLRMKYGLEPNVSIYGFVENVHQLMAVSSCIIAKAGGLTLSEALALQVPVFIYRPFAGQEKENAVFLSKEGAAYISQHVEELALQISRFLSEPDLAEVMKRHMRRLHKKFASDAIARDILHSRSERIQHDRSQQFITSPHH